MTARRPRCTRRMPGSRGFTLLEMMLVVVIIGVLATVVVINIGGATDGAKTSQTITYLSQIKSALGQYYARHGSYPASLTQLTTGANPMLEKIPRDGWKSDFFYLTPAQERGKDYSLYSAGKDKQPGTADDISVWTMDEIQ